MAKRMKAHPKRDPKPKKLYRSRDNRVIAGVCGGLGEFFDTDPIWFRLGFLLLFFGNGIGLIAYILLWVLVPENSRQKRGKEGRVEAAANQLANDVGRKDGMAILGLILLVLGVVFLLDNLFSWFSFHMFWPVLIILLGLYILGKGGKK